MLSHATFAYSFSSQILDSIRFSEIVSKIVSEIRRVVVNELLIVHSTSNRFNSFVILSSLLFIYTDTFIFLKSSFQVNLITYSFFL